MSNLLQSSTDSDVQCLCVLLWQHKVRGQATIGARNMASSSSGSGTFITARANVTELVGQDLPSDTRNDLLAQDEIIDEISSATGEILAISRSMGTELDRQTAQCMYSAVLMRQSISQSEMRDERQVLEC
jgi:hypothetical protein